MNTLVLMRHAKAETERGLGDFQRALAPRGRKQAASFGEQLAEVAGPFDVALVSGALRTRETYRLLAGSSPAYPTRRVIEDLYETTARQLMDSLKELGTPHHRVIVVGHEPVMSTLAYMLHDAQDKFAQQISMGIATATAVVLDVPVPWRQLDRNRAHVRAVLRPDE